MPLLALIAVPLPAPAVVPLLVPKAVPLPAPTVVPLSVPTAGLLPAPAVVPRPEPRCLLRLPCATSIANGRQRQRPCRFLRRQPCHFRRQGPCRFLCRRPCHFRHQGPFRCHWCQFQCQRPCRFLRRLSCHNQSRRLCRFLRSAAVPTTPIGASACASPDIGAARSRATSGGMVPGPAAAPLLISSLESSLEYLSIHRNT